MTFRFRTGNSATLTLAGTLTTGVHTAWVGNIKSIDPGEWTLGERPVDLLADTGFMRVAPQDLATPNEVSGVVLYSASVGMPPLNKNIGTATITLPQVSTATSSVARVNVIRHHPRHQFPDPDLQGLQPRPLSTLLPC